MPVFTRLYTVEVPIPADVLFATGGRFVVSDQGGCHAARRAEVLMNHPQDGEAAECGSPLWAALH